MKAGELTDEILIDMARRIACGETLMSLCREYGCKWNSVCDARRKRPEIGAMFNRARDDGFDAIAEEALAISDNIDEDPASRRVRVETRLKLLAKWDPRRYGDAITLKGDRDNPLHVPHQLSRDELMRIAAGDPVVIDVEPTPAPPTLKLIGRG